MNRIDELIQEYCPEGVEFRYLWEVTAWDKKFNAVDNHKQKKTYKYTCLLASALRKLAVDGGDVKLLSTGGEVYGYTTEELAGKNIGEGEIIAIPWGGKATVQYYNGRFVTADNRIATSLDRSYLSNKYLYYFMLSKLNIIQSFYRGSGIQHPSMAKVLDMRIPIPPLEVQKEIVKILDTFTELEAELSAELSAELAARKRQYEYYRNQLLTFDDAGGVRWTTLGETGMLIRGNGLQKKDFTETGFPAIHYGQIYTHYGTFADKTKSFVSEELAKKLRHAQKGDVLIAGTSENIEDVNKATGWLGDEEIAISGDMFAFRPDDSLNGKFLTYLFQTNRYFTHKKKYANGTKVIRLSGDAIKKFELPVPSLEEQNRIVSILDKFDVLTNDISQGLPAEITARRQQYEYYRTKLLTFKELPV